MTVFAVPVYAVVVYAVAVYAVSVYAVAVYAVSVYAVAVYAVSVYAVAVYTYAVVRLYFHRFDASTRSLPCNANMKENTNYYITKRYVSQITTLLLNLNWSTAL